jgi:putative hydrolase of the HAD superfamily
LKIERQFFHLQDNKHLGQGDYASLINLLATDCNNIAAETIRYTSQTLEWLYAKYPLVMVSNFYGNLATVLTGFGIRNYFREVIESSVVGVRKPSPAIYALGVQALHLPAGDCVVIGDSYTKDMVPGKEAGCQTIWLKKAGFGDDPETVEKADRIIGDLSELRQLL